jgi:hypothetical protein
MKPIVRVGSKHQEASTGQRIDAEYAPPYVLAAALTSTVTISNTNTSVLSLSIPANTLKVGDVIEVYGHGRFNSSATASTDKLSVTLGTGSGVSNPIVTTTGYSNGATSRTNMPAMFQGLLVVRAVGSSASIMGEIMQQRHVASVNVPTATSAALTFNSTVNNLVSLTYLSGNSVASMSFETAFIKLWR